MCPVALTQSLGRSLGLSPARCAWLRSLLARRPLPPGDWIALDEVEKSDRTFLVDRFARLGPVFKALAWGDVWVCVNGLARGRRLLKEHGAVLRPVTLHLAPLFPHGFLRQMSGDTHRTYRQALMRAVQPEDFTACEAELAEWVRNCLDAHVAASGDEAAPAADYITTLNAITSGLLIRLFFGTAPGSAVFARLMEAYRDLGPFGVVWNIGPRQVEAFGRIRAELLAHVEQPATQAPDNILSRAHRAGSLDDTLLGNLIYMVEMGRYDMYSLLRWLTKHLADHPAWQDRLADEAAGTDSSSRSATECFVWETLRMDQSERLLRRVEKDIVFDGFFIPRGATVRVCLWESHKDDGSFPDPFRFDPERFRDGDPDRDAFAPFGLDQHQCPLGDLALRTSVLFVRELARSHRVEPTCDGLPVRGAYHWEPASRFSPRLTPRHSGETNP
jgi:cytochrome P450